MIKFFDTCSIIQLQEEIFESKFLVSSITLHELENIKTSKTKDDEIKYKVRKVLHLLAENEDLYEVIVYKYDDLLKENHLPPTADSQIIISALVAQQSYPDLVFITQDLACKNIAKSVGLKTEYSLDKRIDDYTGYLEVEMDDLELSDFYNNIIPSSENKYDLLENQYLLIKQENEIIDKYKWAGSAYVKVPFYTFDSKSIDKIKPQDDYQHIAMDTLSTNQITVLRGKAGSGKSYLGLGYLMTLLDKGKIDRIVIFTNTVAVRGAAKLGFYPGSKNEKLLDSQIGNFLAAKLGDITAVERMIRENQLILLPVSDCRGVDTTGMNAGIYVTEAQNSSIDMMKLILQRIGEDSPVVIEGDDVAQVDMQDYAGSNNGLKRLSEVFRGHNFYGEVTLPIIHRSKIAELAEQM